MITALNDLEPCAVFLPFRPSSEGASAWGGTYDTYVRPGMVTALETLDNLIDELGLDGSRQYLYGESMGGEGVFKLLVEYPNRFAAAVSVAGYTVVTGAEALAQTPFWIIHGGEDSVADVTTTRELYQMVLDAGGDQIIYTEYETADHVPSITQSRTEPGLVDWILSHTRE